MFIENRATTITPTVKRRETNVHANSTFYDPSTWNFMWLWIFSHCSWSTYACSTITRSNGQWTFPIHFTLNSNYAKVYFSPSPRSMTTFPLALCFSCFPLFLFSISMANIDRKSHISNKNAHTFGMVCIFAQFSSPPRLNQFNFSQSARSIEGSEGTKN